VKPIDGLNLAELVAKAYDADLEARAEDDDYNPWGHDND